MGMAFMNNITHSDDANASRIRKFRVSTLFKTVNSLQKALRGYFLTFLTSIASDVEVGYITPGYGARGKQLWIIDDIDIEKGG